MNENTDNAQANEEQFLYAKILAFGMYIGLGLLLATFFLYASGIMSPAVPLEALDNYWNLDSHHYMEAIEKDHLQMGRLCNGWSWCRLLGKGDYVNFIGIAILASVTIFCFLAIVPALLRKGDKVYAVIALLEAAILSLAASGILAVGH